MIKIGSNRNRPNPNNSLFPNALASFCVNKNFQTNTTIDASLAMKVLCPFFEKLEMISETNVTAKEEVFQAIVYAIYSFTIGIQAN